MEHISLILIRRMEIFAVGFIFTGHAVSAMRLRPFPGKKKVVRLPPGRLIPWKGLLFISR